VVEAVRRALLLLFFVFDLVLVSVSLHDYFAKQFDLVRLDEILVEGRVYDGVGNLLQVLHLTHIQEGP
jgi:hypothetical protein